MSSSNNNDQKRLSWAETISSASEATLPMEDNSSSSYVEKTVLSLEKRPSSSSSKPLSKNYWARKYHHLVADFEDQHEELEDLHDEVRDVKDALKEEKRRCSRYKSEAAEMKRDLKAVVADRENLYQECLKMKELLKQRDADRDSLVAQVNLLIQVGNMNKTSTSSASPERNTAPDPTRSRQMTNIKQELATRVTDKKNKRGAMNNLRAELSSFFSAKQSSSDHRHDTEESLNDSPTNRSSIFQRRGSEELDGKGNNRRSSRGSYSLPFGQEGASASGGLLWRSWSSVSSEDA